MDLTDNALGLLFNEQNSLQPLRERFAVQDSSLKEKQSELDTIIARRSRLEAECNTIRRVLDDQTDRVRFGYLVHKQLNKALLDLEQKRVALANAVGFEITML